MPWEALSPAIYPLPTPSLTCCLSAVTGLNRTGGSVNLSSFSSGPRGVVFDGGGAMLAAAASSPARPSSSTLLGHDAPNPSIHGQQLDPGCVDHPVAPPLAPEHDGSNWGKTPRSQVPSGPAAIDTITATAPNAVTTPPPPARGLGGHPWSYSPLFLLESSEQHVCPSPGSPTPRWSTVPRAIVVTTTDKLPPPKRTHVGATTILWTRVNCSPLLKTGHPTLHTLSPPSPPGAASREVSPGTQRSCCGRVC